MDTRSKKISPKKKGFKDSLSYSTPQKSEQTRGNAITQPRSHPIKKNVEFRDGMGPCGVTLDNEGFVYVVDYSSNCVYKY